MRAVGCVALTVVLGCEYRNAGLDIDLLDAGADGPGQADGPPLDVPFDGTGVLPGLDAETEISPACRPHEAFCDGACIPVSLDVDNCGGCGIVCGSGQTCAGGACTSACPPGSAICDRRCVDMMTSNAHCGACSAACDMDHGCVEGTCRPATSIGPAPTCPPAGATVPLGKDTAGPCAAGIAQTVFRNALCSCGELNAGQGLSADAFTSTVAPYVPDSTDRMGAGVGLNGTMTAGSAIELWGDLRVSSQQGITAGQEVTVRQELHCGGKLKTSKPFTVGGDGWVNGDVTAGAAVAFAGTLHVPDTAKLSTGIVYGALERAPVTVPPPCDCETSSQVPIAAAVEWARLHNDNGVVGLDPALLRAPGDPTRLDLPCGRYYLSSIGGAASITIAVHGRALLFVGGNVQPGGSLRIAVDATAELDVFVAGSVLASRPMFVGSPASPAFTRVYILGQAGQDALRISDGSLLGAFFYAPSAAVTASGALELLGGVFAGELRNSGKTTIHYDRAVRSAGSACAPAP